MDPDPPNSKDIDTSAEEGQIIEAIKRDKSDNDGSSSHRQTVAVHEATVDEERQLRERQHQTPHHQGRRHRGPQHEERQRRHRERQHRELQHWEPYYRESQDWEPQHQETTVPSSEDGRWQNQFFTPPESTNRSRSTRVLRSLASPYPMRNQRLKTPEIPDIAENQVFTPPESTNHSRLSSSPELPYRPKGPLLGSPASLCPLRDQRLKTPEIHDSAENQFFEPLESFSSSRTRHSGSLDLPHRPQGPVLGSSESPCPSRNPFLKHYGYSSANFEDRGEYSINEQGRATRRSVSYRPSTFRTGRSTDVEMRKRKREISNVQTGASPEGIASGKSIKLESGPQTAENVTRRGTPPQDTPREHQDESDALGRVALQEGEPPRDEESDQAPAK